MRHQARLAFQSAGGTGAPIFETYALQLELAAAERFADSMELARRIPDIIRECGEANAALLEAADPSADSATRQTALRETEEAMNALKSAMPLVQERPAGASPDTAATFAQPP